MTVPVLLDSAGRRRSPATMPGYHAGRPPRNKGMRYPADPPTVEEIVAVMRHTGEDRHGWRLRAMIVALWRGGLRIHEALALAEYDLDPRRGSLLVRNGKGGKRREVGMDEWGWEHLRPWLTARPELPIGPLFCIIDGPPADDPGRAPRFAPSSADSPRAQASGVGSPRTNCATPTRSSWRARASRSTSSSANSGTPSSARPRSTCKERPRGDHRRRARTPGADDVGQRRAATLSDRITSESAPALPLRPDGSRRLHAALRCSRVSSAAGVGLPVGALATPRKRQSVRSAS
jgi:Phage integrase family